MIIRQREISAIKERIAIRENDIQATIDDIDAIRVRIEPPCNKDDKDALEEWKGDIAESYEYIAAIEKAIKTSQHELRVMNGETFYVRPSEKTRPAMETTLFRVKYLNTIPSIYNMLLD